MPSPFLLLEFHSKHETTRNIHSPCYGCMKLAEVCRERSRVFMSLSREGDDGMDASEDRPELVLCYVPMLVQCLRGRSSQGGEGH